MLRHSCVSRSSTPKGEEADAAICFSIASTVFPHCPSSRLPHPPKLKPHIQHLRHETACCLISQNCRINRFYLKRFLNLDPIAVLLEIARIYTRWQAGSESAKGMPREETCSLRLHPPGGRDRAWVNRERKRLGFARPNPNLPNRNLGLDSSTVLARA